MELKLDAEALFPASKRLSNPPANHKKGWVASNCAFGAIYVGGCSDFPELMNILERYR